LGLLLEEQFQVALHQAIVEGQPQPGPAAAHVCVDKDQMLQFRDDVSAKGESRLVSRNYLKSFRCSFIHRLARTHDNFCKFM
jgi:hypothetical protein